MLSRLTAAAILALAVAATPAAEARDRVFGGQSAQGEPLVIKATAKGDRLKSVVLAWEAPCGNDSRLPASYSLRPVSLSAGFEEPGPTELLMSRNAGRRFRGQQVAGMTLSDTESAAITLTFSGRLTDSAATGKLDARVTILRTANGEPIDECRTGSVRWRVSRDPSRIYGGATSQDEPVVLRLNASRTRVADLLIGWDSARCEPPGFIRLGDSLSDFVLRAGRFADTFTQTYEREDGGTNTFTYDVRGRVSRQSASGAFSARFDERAGDGAQAMCESGKVSWKATTG